MPGARVIVHVLGRMTAGGNERLCLELIRRAPPGVHQALITIDPESEGPLQPLFEAVPGLEFFHEPYARTTRARFVLRLARRLRALQPRGIVCYPFGLHLLVALAAKVVPGCRFISHVGNPPAPEGPRRLLFQRIVRASRWLGTPLWSCSGTVHDQFRALGLGLPVDSRAMPNGVNICELRLAAARGSAKRTEPGPVVAMMARLDAIKDHDTVLDAFAIVLQERPQARLWLVGDGERRAHLEQRAATLGLFPAVTFMGVRKSIGELLGQVDVFVFSTTAAEGFGIALAEAMAVGLPIAASDVPACREVLASGVCGTLVPPRDAAALARAINVLIDDPDHGQQRAAAVARARAHYDISDCASKYY